MKTIGHKIKELRKEKGISQEELSLALDVSRQTIHKWESNVMRPGTDNIKLLCDYFKVSSDYFINENSIVDKAAVADSVTTIDNAIVADETRHKKTNKYFIGCIIISIIVTLGLIVSLCYTVGIGIIVFSDNVSFETITTIGVQQYAFYLFLVLSTILFALDVVMAFYIKKNR